MNTFIAFYLPTPAKAVLTASLDAYRGKLITTIPEAKWHMTLVFLGDIKLPQETIEQLQKPLHTAYLPAITILSLGACLPAGRHAGPSQLWAHIHATPALIQVRKLIINRLTQCGIPIPYEELAREFLPHITLGNTATDSEHISITDTPAKITFAVREALVLRSIPEETTSYERITTIPLVP